MTAAARMGKWLWAAALGLALAGPAIADGVKPCTVDASLNLTPDDAARLEGLAQSRARGLGAVADEKNDEIGAMMLSLYGGRGLQPLTEVVPGTYRCRTIKLGGQAEGMVSLAYGYFTCRIAADKGGWSIAKITGSQNFVGQLTRAGDGLAYKGASNYGYEGPHKYGDDPEDNQVGCMYGAPLGERHYVLELPSPQLESLHDLIELQPGGGARLSK